MKSNKAGESKTGTFDTPGGRSYLENLERLHPTEKTRAAIERVKAEDAAKKAKS